MKYAYRNFATAILISALPLAAQAHPGHETSATLAAGFMHPLAGWDHLLTLLSLGMLAAGRGARLALGAGALLAVALAGGAMFGLAFPQAAFVESAILVTVLVSALLLAGRVQFGGGTLLALCLGFTLVHGMAHGQEAPAGDLPAYFAGFTAAGTALYGIGLWLGHSLQHRPGSRVPGAAVR